ncbi:MAG TPA: hypothetical protein VEC14_03520 [Reyranellaceae bacterium]|nr:hypothetical protein [Reyranellaceae bacterium]
MIVTRVIAAIAAAAAAPAIAQQPPAQPEPEPITVTGEKPADEKLVCKMTDTGSMMRKRVCLPKSEWAKLEADSQDNLKTLREWQRVRCNFGSIC